MEIRLATEADLAQLVAISEAAGSAAHWSHQQWLAIFHTEVPARRAWIAEERAGDGGSPHAAGFLVAQIGFSDHYDREWELESVAVHPGFRRRGVARSLLSVLLAQARQQRAEQIFLEVRESNRAAIVMYTAAGFQQLGKRPRYYLNPTEDALIMVHTL